MFNNLVGRVLQKDAGQPEQIVICLPLLVGLDGVKKMSKSQDNYIAFNDPPKEMFGKIMSISDPVMWDYYRLLLEESDEAIKERQASHPMAAKKTLAVALVAKFHGAAASQHELDQFEKVFARHEIPDQIKTFPFNSLNYAPPGQTSVPTVTDILFATHEFESKKEIQRLFKQGAVKLNGEKIHDPFHKPGPPEKEYIFQAGKRIFVKIVP